MKPVLRLLSPLLLFVGLSAFAGEPATPTTRIPFDQLGAEAQKQYTGDGIGITPTADGAKLKAIMQRLEGEATPEGLWLTSTADADTGKPNRFRLMAAAVGRASDASAGQSSPLAVRGTVQATSTSAGWIRPGLVEEYSVSVDGVRQDFVIAERPAGAGELQVELAITGARAERAAYGARLTVADTGRVLAYTRLHVTDATGKELAATLQVVSEGLLRVVVQDTGAQYPVRIDPTFSDANWVSLSQGMPGADGPVYAVVTDGSGNLYIGGDFWFVSTASAYYVAKWDGTTWSALGSGMDRAVNALAMIGGNLYAGGTFTTAGGVSVNRIAKWDGSAWSPLGSGVNSDVLSMTMSGSDLYVGGNFNLAGGVSANRIAKWDGSAWSALGAGMDDRVLALAASGSDLYAGGVFTTADGVTVNRIAKWDGTAWSALGAGMNSEVNALAVSGGNLYAGGLFTTADSVSANYIAKWDGSAWSPLGAGMNAQVLTLVVSGSALYAGGNFTTAGGVSANYIAKWDSSAWSALNSEVNGGVQAIAFTGSDMYAGGRFKTAGGLDTASIAKWNGTAWSSFAQSSGTNADVRTLVVSGSALYAGGFFTVIGGVRANYIAKWNGAVWSPLGSGVNNAVFALAVIGGDVYAGGRLTAAGGVSASRIAKWDGTAWSPLGSGVSNTVSALAVSGSDLYVGGNFFTAGGVSANCVAKWDGSTWSPLGSGVNNSVNALLVKSGDLYAGGTFIKTGAGVSMNYIAKWDGSVWSPLGSGMNNFVYVLASMGSDLYAGGEFTTAGGASANRIAKWDGSAWSPLGSGMNNYVAELAVKGGDLYAGGNFTTADGVSAKRIAKWDGSAWSPLGIGIGYGAVSGFGAGLSAQVQALAIDGAGDLVVGGYFYFAGTTLSPYIAKAILPTVPGDVDLLFAPVVDGPVTTTALQADTRLLIGGSFASVGGVTRHNLARLLADDTLDADFDPNANGSVDSVLALADGHLIIGGAFTALQPNGAASATMRNRLALLNADGTVDAAFNPNLNGAVLSLAQQADGDIVAAGSFTTVQPNGSASPITRNRIARFNSNGTLDTAFNADANGTVRCVAVQPDGRLLIGGDFTTVGGVARAYVARLNSNGTLDTTFTAGTDAAVSSITVQPDGKVIIAGEFTTVGGTAHQGIARLSATGVLDAVFTGTTNGAVRSVALQADGKLLLAGDFTTADGAAHHRIARFEASGTGDATFNASVQGAGTVAVSSLMLQANGKVIIGGSFTSVSGTARSNLARLANDAAVQTLAPDGTSLVWMRGTTLPEAVEVLFDVSTDGGDTWTPWATGARIAGGWEAADVALLPPGGLLRGRARTLSGQNDGSSGWVVSQATFSLPAAEIIVEQPENTALTSGATIAFGTVGLNVVKPIVITVRNAGGQPLLNVKATLTGTNANQFSITAQPATTVDALESTTLTVQAKVTTVGAKTAVLNLASNDADENPFLLNLSATGATASVPTAATGAATTVSYTSATLNGTVDAKGNLREIYFDYGPTTAYGTTIAATPATLSGTGSVAVSANVSGLPPHTLQHFRVRAVGDLGIANGADKTLTTLNHAPVGVADPGTIVVPGAVATIDVLANDTDDDDDTLTISAKTAVTPATAGTVAISGNQLVFTAKSTFTGTATFSYTLSDGAGGTSTALVTVTSGVIDQVSPPSVSLPAAGITYPVTVTTTGAWAAGESLTWATISPTRGNGNGTVFVTLTPNATKTARTGSITIGTATHSITQAGVLAPTLDDSNTLRNTTVEALVSAPFSLTIPTTNAPVTYAETNLPPGLTLSDATGILSGLPTSPGTYAVTIKATNAAATTAGAAATLSFSIHVSALPADVIGTFNGLVERSPSIHFTPYANLGARFEMTTTSVGAVVSGKVIEGVTSKSFTGKLTASVTDPNHPTCTATLTGTPFTVDVTLDATTNTLIGTLRNAVTGDAAIINAWRNTWRSTAPVKLATAYAAQHNFAIENTDADHGPQGFGYGSFIPATNTGVLKITGALPDGSTLLCSTFVGPNGQVLLYQSLHKNAGSCLGTMTVTPGGSAPTGNTIAGSFTWLKPASPASAKDIVYGAGFGPLPLVAEGGTYKAPGKGELVKITSLVPGTNNAHLAFTAGGLDTEHKEFQQALTIANPSTTGFTNTATVPTNTNSVKLPTLTAATGLFSGSFIIPGATTALNRTAPFSGQIVPTATGTQGFGYFLLPTVPGAGQTVTTSPKLSGRVQLIAP